MTRLVIILSLVGLTAPVFAQEKARPCPKNKRIEVLLTAGEFKIPAYDARRGLMVVRPMTELLPGLVREFSVRLKLSQPEVLMALRPDSLSLGMETGPADLELVIEGEPAAPVVPPADKPDCAVLTVRSMRLQRGGVVLSRRDLAQPVDSPPIETKVYTRLHVERGEARAPALEAVGRRLSERCVRRALMQTPAIQGAVSLQLAKTLLGKPEEPKIVVDGLVNHQLSYCLVAAFRDEAQVWTLLEPASRAYLSLYLRGTVGAAERPAEVEAAVLRSAE